MKTEQKEVKLIILEADEGKIIVSKEKVQTDEKGTLDYAVKSKKLYLGINDSVDNYMEIDE